MLKYRGLFILIFASMAVSAQFRTETEYLTFEGLDRSYEIFVPHNYSQSIDYSLLFVLHGGGGTGKGLVRTTRNRFNKLAGKNNFIVVYPNGYEKSWNDGGRDTLGIARKLQIDDVGFFKKMMKDLMSRYSVNSNNTFACGISNGGFMVQRLAYELSNKIKGIGVVAANMSDVQSKKALPANPVSVLFINGTHDPLVPYKGGYVTVFKQKRGKVLSVEESIENWNKINACSTRSVLFSYPNKNKKDGCTAQKVIWQNPKNPKNKVVAVTVIKGGHTWPGTNQYLPKGLVGNTNRDFNGCDEIVDFFKTLMD